MAMKRRTRQRLYRVVMYAIFIALVAWAIISTDWARFAKQFLDPAVAAKLFPDIIVTALVNTLWFTLVGFVGGAVLGIDRKSTRLNSSHVKISYAVFC